jgi:hypothetical protein
MSKPNPQQPDGTAVEDDGPITPEEERIIRERLATFDEDVKTARPAAEVLERLLRRHPAP